MCQMRRQIADLEEELSSAQVSAGISESEAKSAKSSANFANSARARDAEDLRQF